MWHDSFKCARTHTHTHTHTHINICSYIYMRHLRMHICIYVYMYCRFCIYTHQMTHSDVHTHTHTHTGKWHIYIYEHICVCVCVCVCVHIWMNTHQICVIHRSIHMFVYSMYSYVCKHYVFICLYTVCIYMFVYGMYSYVCEQYVFMCLWCAAVLLAAVLCRSLVFEHQRQRSRQSWGSGAQRKACLAGEACSPLSAYNVQSCFESLCCASVFARNPCLSNRKRSGDSVQCAWLERSVQTSPHCPRMLLTWVSQWVWG